jgi:hypothetical protein
MHKLNWFLLIFVLGVFASCSKTDSTSNLYTPTTADTTANATLAELQQGRTLYISNCGKCHSLHSPDDYSVSSWKSIMSRMAPNTSMNSSQVLLVTKYVCKGKQ